MRSIHVTPHWPHVGLSRREPHSPHPVTRDVEPEVIEPVITENRLTSSRNPRGHAPLWQEAIGVLSWGGLSFAAIVFVRWGTSENLITTWVIGIFVATWIATALAARVVRNFPTHHEGTTHDRHP